MYDSAYPAQNSMPTTYRQIGLIGVTQKRLVIDLKLELILTDQNNSFRHGGKYRY